MRGTMSRITVKADCADLIVVLKKNREAHQAEHVEAMDGWRVEMQRAISKVEDQLESGDWRDADDSIVLPKPTSFVSAYDQAIGMLEMHTGSEIEIDAETYSCFVDDKWEWKDRFEVSNSRYRR